MAGYYPIIYVRGYAIMQSEVESTFNSKGRGKLKYDCRWSSENAGQSGAVQNEMFSPLPAAATRYFRGGSLRVLFDEWS